MNLQSHKKSSDSNSDSQPSNSSTKQEVRINNESEKGVNQLQLNELSNNLAKKKSPIPPANNPGLPDQLKNGIEQLSGHSMDDVKVHYNSSKPAQLQAHAYAQGNQIHLGIGQEKHLPHEAWHVVQQKQGRVKTTRQLKGEVNINDDLFLEKEADVMGAKAMQLKQKDDVKLHQLKAYRGSIDENTVIQGRFGLELEFPIPVDELGVLSQEQQDTLDEAPDNSDRRSLQKGANLPKDTNIDRFTVDETSGAFSIVTDHQVSRFRGLATAEPAQVIYPNVLEFKYSRPIETLYESKLILDAIYAKVEQIETATNGFTQRVRLKNDFFVGPINTGGFKPDQINGNAASIQINFGIEPQKLPDFLTSYAESTELQGDSEVLTKTRANLVEAAKIGVKLAEDVASKTKTDSPLNGLKGIFSIMALYALSGKDGQQPGTGTIKNFTPLFLKTNLNDSAAVLTQEEASLFDKYREEFLKSVLIRTGRGSELDQQLVKNAKVGDTALELIGKSVPFAGKTRTYLPDSVGPSRVGTQFPGVKDDSSVQSGPISRTKNRRKGLILETRYASGSYNLQQAKAMAEEMFMRVEILHNVPDDELMTSAGQSDFVKRELGVEEV